MSSQNFEISPKYYKAVLMLLFVVLITVRFSAQSMVAYYPFNGNANDETGNGNNGTVIGAVLTMDRFGQVDKAYEFVSPNHIEVPANVSFFNNQFTISYWSKIGSYFGERGVFSCVGQDGGYQQYYSGTSFAYLILYNFLPGGGFGSANISNPPPVGSWHHFAVTYEKLGTNASITMLYVDGQWVKTDNFDLAIGYPGGNIFHIGQNHGGVNFQGVLDDIRVYDAVLDAAEISALYNTEMSCPSPNECLVSSSANQGPGTLRFAIENIEDGGVITFQQAGSSPSIQSNITFPLDINKNITIQGLNPSIRPIIEFDFANMTSGFQLYLGKTLTLKNVDFQMTNVDPGDFFSSGPGTILIGEGSTTEIK